MAYGESYSAVHIVQPAIAHVGFYLQVHDRLLLTVIDSGNACQVALALVCLDPVDDIHRKVLGGHLAVIAEILLSVNENPGYCLSVHRYPSVLIHLHTGKTLDKLLKHRTFGNTERTHIEHEGIIHHLCGRK